MKLAGWDSAGLLPAFLPEVVHGTSLLFITLYTNDIDIQGPTEG